MELKLDFTIYYIFTYHVLHNIYYILHTTCYILHTRYYKIYTTYYILHTTSWHTTYYILHITYILHTTYYYISGTYYILNTTYYILLHKCHIRVSVCLCVSNYSSVGATKTRFVCDILCICSDTYVCVSKCMCVGGTETRLYCWLALVGWGPCISRVSYLWVMNPIYLCNW